MNSNELENLKDLDDHTLLILMFGEIHSMKSSMKSEYVTRHEFTPVKLIVYGMIGCLITGIVGALLTMLVTKGG